MFTAQFWKDSTERAVKTLAQFILVLAAGNDFNVFDIDAQQVLGLALGGVIVSYAFSIASTAIGDKDSPSLLKTGASSE